MGLAGLTSVKKQAQSLIGLHINDVFDLKNGVKRQFHWVDCPIWDLIGQLANKPVYSLLNQRQQKPTFIWIEEASQEDPKLYTILRISSNQRG